MLAESHPRRRLKYALVLLAALAVLSIVGFHMLGSLGGDERSWLEAVHLTANIFSTVGAWKADLNRAEQVWEILMIIFGIGAAAYALGAVTAMFTSGEIARTLGRRNQVDQISNLSDHYIVCGYGRMGRSVCGELDRDGVPFVLVELDPEHTAAAGAVGYKYILGDASDEVVLRHAGIDRAKGLVTCLPHDAENVFVTLTARELSQKLHIIARAELEATERRLVRAGADRVVCPAVMGALKMTRMLLQPAVEDLLDATVSRDLAIDRIDVAGLNDLAGQSLRDAGLPARYGLMVLAVDGESGRRVFNPPADHVLARDDQLLVIGPREAIDRMVEDKRAKT